METLGKKIELPKESKHLIVVEHDTFIEILPSSFRLEKEVSGN